MYLFRLNDPGRTMRIINILCSSVLHKVTVMPQFKSNLGRVTKRFLFVFGLFLLVIAVITIQQHKPLVQIQIDTTENEKCIDKINLFGIPGELNLEKTDNNSLYLLFNRYVNHIQFFCRNLSMKGPKGSYGKIICADSVFVPGPQCVAYSFGSQFKFEFEDAIWKSFKCEIHTFDPSLSTEGKVIPTYIDYHLIGLSGKNFDQTEPEIWRHHDNPMLKKWKMRTLSTIMDSLKHSKMIIDILKIDIEGWEWDALPEMMRSDGLRNVKQICLEVHFGFSFKNHKIKGKLRPTYTKNTWGNVPIKCQIKILKQLFDYGFRIVNYAPLAYDIVINKQTIKPLYELTLINLNFLY